MTGCQTASVKQPETAVTATQTETEKVSEEEPAAVVDTVTLYITRHGKTMLNTSDRSQAGLMHHSHPPV